MKLRLSSIPSHKLVFIAILSLPILFFNAFNMHYFGDDFAFLKASRVSSMQDFLNFFNPVRETFYRPLSSEVFYALHHVTGYNVQLAHILVFLVFAIGLIGLFKLLTNIHINKTFAELIVAMYSIHFSHVFQLYWFATFQEVLLFTSLVGALLYAVKGSVKTSLVLFVVVLLSKETALVFLPLLILVLFAKDHGKNFSLSVSKLTDFARMTLTKHWKMLILSLGFTVAAFIIYSFGLSNTSKLPQYAVRFSPRLMIDTAYWYTLWSLGFPSFLPDYMSAMVTLPHKEFWGNFVKPSSVVYLYSFAGYISVLLFGSAYLLARKSTRMEFLMVAIVMGAVFYGTMFPSLLVSHKWMVRLTVPLVASMALQVYIVYALLRNSSRVLSTIGAIGIACYIVFNIGAIPLHESTSTYNLENLITTNAHDILSDVTVSPQNSDEQVILFFEDDETVSISAWEGSEKLKTTFGDQNFIDHYFSVDDAKKIVAVYDFESDMPEGAVVLPSRSFFALQ